MSKITLEQLDLAHLKSAPLWELFLQLSQIPRPSGHEEGVRQWIRNLAKEHQLNFKEDSAGNLVIYVPASADRIDRDKLILQNHMDMVCDHTPENPMNFETDPITLKRDGNWIMADGSTLGADNGMGLCAALCIMSLSKQKIISHPALEILCTADEESGLHGALNLDPSLLSAKRLINLDTEEWESLYVGCAGGKDWEFKAKFETQKADAHKKFFILKVLGLKGGHSGVDIHLQRGNALKILSELLFQSLELGLQLAQIQGGRAHNIIPRDAWAVFTLDESKAFLFQQNIQKIYDQYLSFLPEEDEELEFSLEEYKNSDASNGHLVLKDSDSRKVLSFLQVFPHGAHKFERKSEHELVSLSSNLAKVILKDGEIYIQSSLRFLNANELVPLTTTMEALAQSYQLESIPGLGYPSWQPVFVNPLLDQIKLEFSKQYGKAPEVRAIHAGLECGIIQDKLKNSLGNIDMVSLGPTIENAHSPSERVNVESVEKFWEFFTLLLSRL